MTIRQRGIVVGILTGTGVVGATIMFFGHLHPCIPLGLLFGLTVSAGKLWGTLEEKWKRDKEMGHLVAERLLGKPKDQSSGGQTMGGTAQQQANKMIQQAVSTNPNISGFLDGLGSAGTGSSQGVSFRMPGIGKRN